MSKQSIKAVGLVAALVSATLPAALITFPHLRVRATGGDHSESRVEQGLNISPVSLNLKGTNRELVGTGSYFVNGLGTCNSCHNAGPGNAEFLKGGNPFFGQPLQENQMTYLGGGRDFGPLIPGSADIISRNLTPGNDRNGLPAGGLTFVEFLQTIRTGIDPDHFHPSCPDGTINTTCVPSPYDGRLLQVMAWYSFKNFTDHDLRAIYEYFSAVPCVAGLPAPSPLHNDCNSITAAHHTMPEPGNDDEENEARIVKGFEIAPVHLNLDGKDLALVGLGSYLVNGPADCNACHNAGPGNNQFLLGGNPFYGEPERIIKATYLGGGRNFGPRVPGSADIISRNLTPDRTGRPGGRTFAEFLQIMRTGVDLDHLHPDCPAGVVNTNCIPSSYDGSVLQTMPWYDYKNSTDHDLRAIYEYLSAIPCVESSGPLSATHNC